MVDRLRFACLSTWGQDIKNSLGEPCAQVCKPAPKLSNKQFTNRFPPLKIPDLVHRPTMAAVAARWRYKLPTPNITPHSLKISAP